MALRKIALEALTVPEEMAEVQSIQSALFVPPEPISAQTKAILGTVKLRRTFNMNFDGVVLKFWRVNCPGHPNHCSDLSVEGLRQWKIIP